MRIQIAIAVAVWMLSTVGQTFGQGAPGKDDESLAAMNVMAETAQAFRAAVAKVRPSLVTIESFGGVGAVQGRIGGIRKQGEGNTTGILISDEGHIITSSFNFIKSPPVITIKTSDGERRVAELLGETKRGKFVC